MTVRTYSPEDVRIWLDGVEMAQPATTCIAAFGPICFDMVIDYAARGWPVRLLPPPIVVGAPPKRRGARA